VRYRKYRINVRVDTGSDIAIAGLDCAKKYRWTMYKHPMKSVKLGNNKYVRIEGVTYVTLCVGSGNIESEIFITPEMTGLIIGVDWLRKRGHFVWDFDNYRSATEDGLTFGAKTPHTAFAECMWAKTFFFPCTANKRGCPKQAVRWTGGNRSSTESKTRLQCPKPFLSSLVL